jgi:hypothetical protein
MFTIAPIYVVAAIAAAVESNPVGAGTAHELTGCDVVKSFERKIHARRGFTLTAADAESLLAGATLLRSSLCASRGQETARSQAA